MTTTQKHIIFVGTYLDLFDALAAIKAQEYPADLEAATKAGYLAHIRGMSKRWEKTSDNYNACQPYHNDIYPF